MAVQNFKPVVWTAGLLQALKTKCVSEAGVNHDYEGEVIGAGSVKINTVGKVTLRDYNGNTIVYDDMDTTEQTLLIDRQKVWAVKLDDVDAAQVKNKGELVFKTIDEASNEVVADRDRANFEAMANGAGVVIGDDTTPIVVSTPAEAKALVLKMKTKADKANVPTEGRVLFAGPELENQLLADTTINLAAPTANDSLKAGYIGKLYGIELYSSNNMPVTADDNAVAILTHKKFTTEAVQIDKTEALRSEGSFKDLVRGLCVSGRKVIMPEGVVKAVVSFE
jgi:hypothetical protein